MIEPHQNSVPEHFECWFPCIFVFYCFFIFYTSAEPFLTQTSSSLPVLYLKSFLCLHVIALLYSFVKKIPWDRNIAALYDEVCAVKNCQLFSLIVFLQRKLFNQSLEKPLLVLLGPSYLPLIHQHLLSLLNVFMIFHKLFNRVRVSSTK